MQITSNRTIVSIKVTGLALCFHSKVNEPVPMWNVVLICDSVHTGHIKVVSGAAAWGQDLYDPARDVLVKFSSAGFDHAGDSSALGKLLNLRAVHDLIPYKA